MSSKIRVAVGQMCSSSNVKGNSHIVSKLIDRAIELRAKVLFLPEASDYISRDASHSVQLAKKTKSDFIDIISEKLKNVHSTDPLNSLSVAVGVHEPTSGENAERKVQNNQLWISSSGEVEHRYQKIHLFDINIPNGPILQESKSVEAGNKILDPFPLCKNLHPDFKVGLSICYDIRFPELSNRLREKGANILTYPSAFTTRTGEAHWLELGRARAIDSQCYVVMAAQCGEHDVYADIPKIDKDSGSRSPDKRTKRISYGQSIIIGPWGDVLAKGPTYREISDSQGVDEEGDYYQIFDAELDLEHLESVRINLPVFSHKRPDVYKT
ncbi:hypothetical protein JCM33374_g3656 [Metschnikowia sp. JCM 33374]|nr:hypothetical protein JCM33374_g3656 [Metschnikowia sp. JCM 33374]